MRLFLKLVNNLLFISYLLKLAIKYDEFMKLVRNKSGE
jgi:hypothetical protein